MWIFFACVCTKKLSTTSDLENRMSLASPTTNAVAMCFEIFALLC